MTPIEFDEQNVVWAKNQPPLLPLPAYSDKTMTVTKWRLSWRERVKILWTGTLWFQQRNLGKPLQAQLPTVDYPFVADIEAVKVEGK